MQFDKDHEAIVRIDLKEVLELMGMYINNTKFCKIAFYYVFSKGCLCAISELKILEQKKSSKAVCTCTLGPQKWIIYKKVQFYDMYNNFSGR